VDACDRLAAGDGASLANRVNRLEGELGKRPEERILIGVVREAREPREGVLREPVPYRAADHDPSVRHAAPPEVKRLGRKLVFRRAELNARPVTNIAPSIANLQETVEIEPSQPLRDRAPQLVATAPTVRPPARAEEAAEILPCHAKAVHDE